MTTSKESFADQIARVRMMSRPSETWDLSDNDRAALKAVLDMHDELSRAPIVDWSKFSPREVYDALRAAPKVAGEWESPPDIQIGATVRHDPDGRVRARVGWLGDGTWYANANNTAIRPALPSMRQAQEACDRELRACGWILASTPTPEARDGG